MADFEAEKALAAANAVEEIRNGMLVGLGTGSTAVHVIRELGLRVATGLSVRATATSRATEHLARQARIPLIPFEQLARVDLAIDGADEVDRELRAIKGGGGALLREKVIAAAADRVIIVADSSKLVAHLGRFPLPIEVIPFAAKFVANQLAFFGVPLALRRIHNQTFTTDQGNYILDLQLGSMPDPGELAAKLSAIPGVVEHGLFLDQVDSVIIARGPDIERMQRAGGPNI